MKFRFGSAKTWRYVISSISKVIDEGVFVFSEDGVKFKAIDPSKIMLIDLFIPKESFIEYDVARVEAINVNMDDLAKILKRVTKNDELGLEAKEGRIAVSLIGRGIRTFLLPSLEASYEEIPELNLKFTVRAKMSPSTFREIVKELKPVGDTIEFSTKSSEKTMIVRSFSDVVEAKVVLSMEDGSLIELEAEEDATSSYGIDYLSEITPVTQVAEEFTLEYGSEIPCKLSFTLPYGGRIVFYVAPRVE